MGVLGFLTVRSVMIGRRAGNRTSKDFSKLKCGIFAFYPCALIAAVDEILQGTVGGRTSTTADVLLDCAGIITGLILSGLKTRGVTVQHRTQQYHHRKGGLV